MQYSSSSLKLDEEKISVSACSPQHRSTFIYGIVPVVTGRKGILAIERISPSFYHCGIQLEAGEASVFVGLHNLGQGFGNLHGVLLERCSRSVDVKPCLRKLFKLQASLLARMLVFSCGGVHWRPGSAGSHHHAREAQILRIGATRPQHHT
jgi:hypothetical protein